MQLLGYDVRSLKANLTATLQTLTVLSSAYMCYTLLGLVCNTATPVVVVLSGSMEPAFQRGDILFMWNRNHRHLIGDVVVYNLQGRSIPIIHRVLRQHSSEKKQLLLTKGDNNPTDDIALYQHKKIYLDRERDADGGRAYAYFPKLGYITLLLTDYPMLKTALIGASMLMAFYE